MYKWQAHTSICDSKIMDQMVLISVELLHESHGEFDFSELLNLSFVYKFILFMSHKVCQYILKSKKKQKFLL